MDTIRFEVEPVKPGATGPADGWLSDLYPTVQIIINAHDLREVVREIEGPFAAAEGIPEFVGQYTDVPAELLRSRRA